MIPSLEIRGLTSNLQTIQDYADLDTGEFNGKCNEVQKEIEELAQMLEENGE